QHPSPFPQQGNTCPDRGGPSSPRGPRHNGAPGPGLARPPGSTERLYGPAHEMRGRRQVVPVHRGDAGRRTARPAARGFARSRWLLRGCLHLACRLARGRRGQRAIPVARHRLRRGKGVAVHDSRRHADRKGHEYPRVIRNSFTNRHPTIEHRTLSDPPPKPGAPSLIFFTLCAYQLVGSNPVNTVFRRSSSTLSFSTRSISTVSVFAFFHLSELIQGL